MRTLVTALAALLFLSPALAADHEASIELGTLANRDTDFDVYSRNNIMPSWGLHGAYAFHERLSVVASWHRVRRGSDLYEMVGSSQPFGRAAFFADELTLGLHADLQLHSTLFPYVNLQGLVVRGVSRFDDDPSDEDSPGQISEAALAPGFMPTGGLEVRIPQGDAPFTIAWHLEAGYGWVGNLVFPKLGDMRPGGFALRSGVGVRF